MSRRMRGGPAPAAGGAADGRVVQPSVNRGQAARMREMMAPSGRGGQRVRIAPERLGADFLREAWAELGKVHWPTREQARNLTALVIAVSIVVGLVLGGVDYVFAKMFQLILGT